MNKGKVLIVLLVIQLLLCVQSYASNVDLLPQPTFNEKTENSSSFNLVQRVVSFDQSGYFFVRQVDFKDSQGYYITRFVIPGQIGTVQYYDKNRKVQTMTLKDGKLPSDTILNIRTNTSSFITGYPYVYKKLGSGTIESLPGTQSSITLKYESDSWIISYKFKKTKNKFGVLWGIGSANEILDLSKSNLAYIWSGYDLSNYGRIGLDGYYFKSPSDYNPTAVRGYWRIPSMYLANSLIKTGGSVASDIFGNSLLIISKDNINELGFFPSLPESTWLKTDYNVIGGYFDTRFNADAGETLLKAYQKFNNPIYREQYLKISDYYIEHIEKRHYSIFSNDIEGWLVDDYFSNNSKRTHVSLNHQLQAINFFLLLYEEEKDEKYNTIAQKMLDGIKNSRNKWIMKNGNLEYAYMPNGQMGLVDYPYLTYNDLYYVQNRLLNLRGSRDSDLDYLMLTKKNWMDKNNITN